MDKKPAPEALRKLTPQEVCAMYHFHDEYTDLGLGAIAYYEGLSARDKKYIKKMVKAIKDAFDNEYCWKNS